MSKFLNIDDSITFGILCLICGLSITTFILLVIDTSFSWFPVIAFLFSLIGFYFLFGNKKEEIEYVTLNKFKEIEKRFKK